MWRGAVVITDPHERPLMALDASVCPPIVTVRLVGIAFPLCLPCVLASSA